MKKILLFIVIVSWVNNIFSQNNSKRISIEFNQLNQKEIIQIIEKNTAYEFFFLEEWFSDRKITKTFSNASLEQILDEIFIDTDINYSIIETSKVVLTKGVLIRPTIFENVKNTNSVSPILVENYDDVDVFIGKEKNQRSDLYTVSGYVINDKTNQPIEGVTILEKEKNIYTTTNKKGYYKLQLPYGKNNLEARYAGFSNDSYTLVIYDNGSLNFSMLEKLEELDEVVIQGEKDKNLRETVTGITQLKAEDIKTIPQVLGERDLLRAVLTLPGIKSAGEGAEGVNVRGGKVDQNLFLLDDGVMYNPTHFLGLFSAINPFTTDDLKIYKGNIPSEYGGRLSSVFDMKTKDGNTQKVIGEASIGPVTGNISVQTPIVKDKSSLLIGLRSTYSDWILELLDDKRLKNSNVSFYDAIVKYSHKFNDKNSLKITGYYSKDKFQIASDSINNYSNIIGTLNFEHKFNDKHKGNLILANSGYNFNIDYKNEGNRNFNLKYKINETDLKLKMQYKHSKKHVFHYGIESKLYNVSPGNINPSDQNSTVIPLNIAKERGLENGIFISDAINLNKKLSFDVGLRFSQFLGLGSSEQRFYEENLPKNESTLLNTISYNNNEVYKAYQGFSYRFSGRYAFENDLSIKAGINKSFQYIHRLSNNTTASPIDTWRLSDVNILPEEGTQFSLGVFKNLADNNFQLSLEGYYKDYKNLIDYKTGATLLLNENIETEVLQGPGKSYGIEFLLRKKVGRANGWLAYTYSRSFIKLDSQFKEETVNSGEFFPTNYDKPHSLDVVFNYKITNRYSVSSNFSYQTGRPVTYPTGKYILNGIEYSNYSNRNAFRIPDYYRLDIGINIEGNHKIKKFAHSFWNISVYNVLGRNNPYSVFFETENGNINGYKSSIFSTPIPTITYNFKF